ncbi:CDP-glycerol glycerophosphotransferase family protein [Planococcus sp. ISL-110]|uniref:CDP-glycerol glycerophosphotransferase family protein n=1 Tax=Planococcus sp. ISL-110 TaxID=2819167 RepID=UPI001BEC0D26|nr:CDP-glycerol glycerophosphotransferase family protein [Planococcus sp. ISL-110]MBT2571229.1 hypothetical protein [Planococcus sp. ISL-110]
MIPSLSIQEISDEDKVFVLRLHYLLMDKIAQFELPANSVDASTYQDIQELYLLTNTETSSLVKQENSRFFFQGIAAQYDITKFNKPKVIVETIAKRENKWQLSEKLWVPKATRPLAGNFNTRDRKGNKDLPAVMLELDKADKGKIYPYEEQSFLIELDADPMMGAGKEPTYDFSFKLAPLLHSQKAG